MNADWTLHHLQVQVILNLRSQLQYAVSDVTWKNAAVVRRSDEDVLAISVLKDEKGVQDGHFLDVVIVEP